MAGVARDDTRPRSRDRRAAWDGQYLLRLLTGLALVGLGLVGPAALPAAAGPVTAVTASAAADPGTTHAAPEAEAVAAEAVVPDAPAARPAVVAADVDTPVARAPGALGSRAPPAV